MTEGIRTGSTDLDNVFAPLQAGWPQAAITRISGPSGDLNGRYARLSAGSAAGPTRIYSDAADLNTIFAGFGTTGVRVGTQPSAVSGVAAAGFPSGSVTSNTTTCAGAGGKESGYTFTWEIISGSATLTAPNSATCGVTNSAVPAADTLTGTMLCTISDGTTTVNTNTVGWSLQNTTPNAWVIVIDAGELGGYEFGFGSSGTLGTIVSGGTFEGLSLDGVSEIRTNSFSIPVQTNLTIGGFSSDPGQNWFSTLTSNGHTYASASASSSTWDSSTGQRTWIWNGGSFGYVVGTDYSVTIQF